MISGSVLELDPVARRLRWARSHLRTLEEILSEYENRAPWEIGQDLPRRPLLVQEARAGRPPQDAALVLGDALHNTRSALDLFVVALADYSQGRRLSDKETERLSFFIPQNEKSLQKFLGEMAKPGKALSNVDPPLIERIWNVQASSHWLPWLRELSNRDKHRRLNIINVADKAPTIAVWNRPDEPGVDLNFEFDEGGYIASISDRCDPARVSFEFTCRLEDPTWFAVSIGGLMSALLKAACEAVSDITGDIAADLDAGTI